MRALVTGAAGFIGSHTVDRLLARGHEVVGIDNFDPYYAASQKRRNLVRALAHPRFALREGDVRRVDDVRAAFERAQPEVVVHLAAKAGVRASLADPQAYLEVNELGLLHVLEACRERRTPLLLASTSSVYGASAHVPFEESDAADLPLSPYASTKRAAELLAHSYYHLHGLAIAALRFFTVYGPRGRPDMAVASFTRALRAGRSIRLHGEETARDFTYVDDIVDGIEGALRWVQGTPRYGVFNLGRTEPVRVRVLVEELARALGCPASIELGRLEPTESPRTAANIARAAAAFGYAPQVSLAEGLQRWVRWYFESPESPHVAGEE
ncbi:MAG: GDP-mannose 4,6-dehydratase [Planctomycetes bacterium]|nr:GDP-mannose 4,6-dehydratase [Planctomycetota bacterium]